MIIISPPFQQRVHLCPQRRQIVGAPRRPTGRSPLEIVRQPVARPRKRQRQQGFVLPHAAHQAHTAGRQPGVERIRSPAQRMVRMGDDHLIRTSRLFGLTRFRKLLTREKSSAFSEPAEPSSCRPWTRPPPPASTPSTAVSGPGSKASTTALPTAASTTSAPRSTNGRWPPAACARPRPTTSSTRSSASSTAAASPRTAPSASRAASTRWAPNWSGSGSSCWSIPPHRPDGPSQSCTRAARPAARACSTHTPTPSSGAAPTLAPRMPLTLPTTAALTPRPRPCA